MLLCGVEPDQPAAPPAARNGTSVPPGSCGSGRHSLALDYDRLDPERLGTGTPLSGWPLPVVSKQMALPHPASAASAVAAFAS